MAKPKSMSSSKGRKWPKSPKQPLVFHFQPTGYQVVPPERLGEWEEAMRKRVGLSAGVVKGLAAGGGTLSFSDAITLFDD
jgi:hypothetical protein